jgi:hypothetical protein
VNDMPKHDDDPRAPYKVYEGEELKGTYPTALKTTFKLPQKSLLATAIRKLFRRPND